MSKTNENTLSFQPTERRQFQFDALDQAIQALANPHLSPAERVFWEREVSSLKVTISLQGPDVGEFVYHCA